MQRKIVVGVIVICCLYTVFSVLPIQGMYSLKNNAISQYIPEYQLDQIQEQGSHRSNVHRNLWYAQSFQPTLTPLVKVEIKIDKPYVINQPLQISIRKELMDNDLTFILIPPDLIPFYTNWIECDFPDIEVNVHETYYIVAQTISPSGTSYRWIDDTNRNIDPYLEGEQWMSNDKGQTWTATSDYYYDIDCTFRTYSYFTKPDLHCEGFFNWTDVAPGQTVTGSFTVQNIGTPLSNLNWNIEYWPIWGVWSLMPPSGENLKPEHGIVTVQVIVEAPHANVPQEYSGKIKIVNTDDPEDSCIIDAAMVTPKKKIVGDAVYLERYEIQYQDYRIMKYLVLRYLWYDFFEVLYNKIMDKI